jgi:hypothetical protein
LVALAQERLEVDEGFDVFVPPLAKFRTKRRQVILNLHRLRERFFHRGTAFCDAVIVS